MALLPWNKGVITRVEDETKNTKRFWIKVPDQEKFDFKPGQFVTLDLPIDEKPNKRWRSYSIASWPDDTNIFELVIVHMEKGIGTSWLWENGHVGAELAFRGPQGVFTLPTEIDRDLFLICTGTGIAPFRSMVHHILNNNVAHKNIYIIYGCRRLEDTLYENELRELEQQVPSFIYLPTFSREAGSSLVRTGYVHEVYEEIVRSGASKSENVAEAYPAYFYLCGWKNMVDEARLRLQQLGYDKKSIHFELYG